MADYEGHGRALRALAALEQDAVERGRAASERARAEASRPAREQSAIVSVPALGPSGMAAETQRHAEGRALLDAMGRQLGRQWATSTQEGPADDGR